MASYTNTVNDPSATVALGSPGLAAGDDISFVRYSTTYTSGADFSGTDLLKVTTGQGFSGSFKAENSAPLKITANRTSTGQYFNVSASARIDLLSTSSTGVIYKIHQLGSGALWVATCKTAGGLWAFAGTTYIAGDVDLTTLNVGGSGVCYQRKSSGAFVPTTVNVYGEGLCRMETDFATSNCYSGTLEINDVSVTPAQVNGYGGTIRIIESGTIGAMLLDGACILDFTQLKIPLTISGTTSVGPGVEIKYRRNGPTVTATFAATSTPYKITYVD